MRGDAPALLCMPTTLQFSNTDPQLHAKYAGSHLIVPCGAQYNDHLYPTILEPQNHCSPLIDPVTEEPCPMEVVGDFKAMDPIFKGSYGDSFLYSDDDLAQLRWQRVYLQEGLQDSRWQSQEWRRQQRPWWFFQSHPKEGWQGGHHQLPGLEYPLGLSDFTMPQ